MNTDLKVAYDSLETALIALASARDGRHLDKENFELVLCRYKQAAEVFNKEVSRAIKADGKVPSIAGEMLELQRYNGFHAKGLAKIIGLSNEK